MSLFLVLILSIFTLWVSLPAGCLALTVVKHLPGFDGPLPFHFETGYVEVDEANGAEIFYYFAKSERKPEEDPLLVWLTGGPGCSGLSGLAFEIGPFKFDVAAYNEALSSEPILTYNPYTWTKICNIIFLDSPIGTGFSYSRNPKGYEMNDTKSAREIHTFVTKWLIDHPEFSNNSLYIAGDSYAGKIAPLVAQEMADGIQAENELLNLKGYIIGNPVTDNQFDSGAVVPFAHGMGLISDELYEAAKQSCGGRYDSPGDAKCAYALLAINKCLGGITVNHILEPTCFLAVPKPFNVIRKPSEGLHSPKSPLPLECRSSGYLLGSVWANDETVREALGIHKGTVETWNRCNTLFLPYVKDVESSIKFHMNLTTRGYRALVYSGDHDLVVPYLGTQAWIRSLNFSIVDDWRSWWVDGQVAGYTRTYSNNLTFATVKGGGHTAPEYKPKECQAMIDRWTSHVAL